MINIIDKKDCVGCNACVQRCPKQCIAMHEDKQGFLYPKVDLDLCINCGLCEKICPVINQAEPRKPEAVFAATNPDKEVLMRSSSGGIFFELAKNVINEGGVVFGAKFNDKWEVVHGYAETLEDARVFQGSKYVQSRISSCFADAERFLKEGRKVMFTGTPCQIAGLRLFLRKPYENLIAVDVVCHGVPSPLVWREYLHSIVSQKGIIAGKNSERLSLNDMPVITGISFRDKRMGWEKYGFSVLTSAPEGSGKNTDFPSLSTKTKEQDLLFEPLNENLYMQIFLKDLDLRPSCYSCPAKYGKSHSDITLADFWGIKANQPSEYDFNGVSIVMANNSTVETFLNDLPLEIKKSSYQVALAGNPSIEKSVSKPKQYNEFWEKFSSSKFEKINVLLSLMRPSLQIRLKTAIKSGIKSIIGKDLTEKLKSILR